MTDQSGQQRPQNDWTFFRGFLRRPATVGYILPSSPWLARRLARVVVPGSRLIVELGAGTGETTLPLLQAMPPEGQLLAVEIDPEFAARLRGIDDSRLIVAEADAGDLSALLARHGFDAADAVVSGIPFSTMTPEDGRSVLRSIWSCLRPGGCFVAYQFRSRVTELARALMGDPEVGVEFRNIPPMRVYRWTKPAAD